VLQAASESQNKVQQKKAKLLEPIVDEADVDAREALQRRDCKLKVWKIKRKIRQKSRRLMNVEQLTAEKVQ